MIAALATAMAGFTSCSNDDVDQATGPAELKISASFEPSISLTRAAYDLQGTTVCAPSAPTTTDYTQIGIFVWYTGKTDKDAKYAGYYNVRATGGSAAGTGDTYPTDIILSTTDPLYFPVDNSAVDVYLYAPFTATTDDGGTPPVITGPVNSSMEFDFTVKADQSADADYIASDFIYGKATAPYSGSSAPNLDKTARITMYHAMSKIILKVVPADGVSVNGLSELKLTGVNRVTKIRMANQPSATMTCGSTSTDHVDVATAATGTNPKDVIFTKAYSAAITSNGVAAIIPPQDLPTSAGAGLGISATIDGKTATADLYGLKDGTTPITAFEPGKVYTITLNVKGSVLEVRYVEIQDWVPGNSSGSSLDLDTWS